MTGVVKRLIIEAGTALYATPIWEKDRFKKVKGTDMQMHETHGEAESDVFSTGFAGLPMASKPQFIDVAPGNSFDLRIHSVAKSIGKDTVRMLSYNGSIPGPTLRVKQGSEIEVDVTNDGDIEATVHWHGLRLENRFDGVPHQTQAPIPVAGSYTRRLTFPDAGVFWYLFGKTSRRRWACPVRR